MSNNNKKSLFWISYSDLMTSLFFTMLVLFVVIVVSLGQSNKNLKDANKELDSLNKKLESLLTKVTIEKENLERLTHINEQFQTLTESSHLGYDEDKCIFYAKDLMGEEIFEHLGTDIKQEYLATVDAVGSEIEKLIDTLNSGSGNFKFQLVIEGTAAIPYNMKINNTYNPDSRDEYELSFKRALALYYRWKEKKINLRKDGNTEIIIAGNGFNGINRDDSIEENNKRFVIQIIPKISRPSGE